MKMNKKPVTYEGDITLRRFCRALKRNFLTIVFFFLLFCVIGAGYLKITTKQRYTSTGYVSYERVNISGSAYQNIANIVLSDECKENTVKALEEKKITHANKAPITFDDIHYGLSSKALDTLRVHCTYTSTDSSIVQVVLDEVMEQAVAIGNDDAHNSLYQKSLIVLTKASVASKVANNTLMKAALFAFVGLALGVAAAIIRENARDTIYAAIDFDELGVVMFPLRYQNDMKTFKNVHSGEQALEKFNQDERLKETLVLAQNSLAVYGNKMPIQSVALVAPREVTEFLPFVKAFAKTYAKDGKTLVVDVNVHQPSLEKIFALEPKEVPSEPKAEDASLDASSSEVKEETVEQPVVAQQEKLSDQKMDDLSLATLAVTIEENLDVIYTDKMTYPDEFYRSDAFKALLKEARKTYKHIVFLSPAWMDYQDLALLHDELDAVALFAMKNKTRRDDIVQSITNFEMLDLPYVGTIFLR